MLRKAQDLNVFGDIMFGLMGMQGTGISVTDGVGIKRCGHEN